MALHTIEVSDLHREADRAIAGQDEICTCGIVVSEVFQGLRRDRGRGELARLFSDLVFLEPSYAADRGGARHLFLRALNEIEARPLEGTSGGRSPFFSPDGQWIGFFAEGKLKSCSSGRGRSWQCPSIFPGGK